MPAITAQFIPDLLGMFNAFHVDRQRIAPQRTFRETEPDCLHTIPFHTTLQNHRSMAAVTRHQSALYIAFNSAISFSLYQAAASSYVHCFFSAMRWITGLNTGLAARVFTFQSTFSLFS